MTTKQPDWEAIEGVCRDEFLRIDCLTFDREG